MIKDGRKCECADYHRDDADHEHGECPRMGVADFGGVWLCEECANAEVD
jgi:hypothetical protein